VQYSLDEEEYSLVRLPSGLLIVIGIILVALGIIVQKSDPNSWVRDFWISGVEFPEWASLVYAGAFFVAFGIVL